MTEPIRLLVVDDHPWLRAGVKALLGLESGIEVIGEAGSGQEAVRLAAELRPDVVLMDLKMPGVITGVDAIRRVVAQDPGITVLVLTVAGDSDSINAAVEAGASGYVQKDADPAQLSRAVHAVADGEFIAGQAAARWISARLRSAARQQPAGVFPMLTAREREILDLIAQGRNNAYLARRLTLSPKTIRNHISNIFAKLHVADRNEAIVRAREAGLGRTPGEAEVR